MNVYTTITTNSIKLCIIRNIDSNILRIRYQMTIKNNCF